MRTERLGHRRVLQFALAVLGNVVPLAIAALSGHHHPIFDAGAAGSAGAAVLVTALPPGLTTIRRVASLAGLPCLTMTQAYSGGVSSFYVVLMMLPVVWFGLQADDRDIRRMLVVLAACAVVPMLTVGAPAFPVHWADAALLLIIAATVAGALRMASRETTKVTDSLRHQALTDPLTGLLNRRGWGLAARSIYAAGERHRRPMTAAVIDLDAFKAINDTDGHSRGDAVLRETSERLRATLRAGDLLARSGGDEFLALLVDTPEAAARAAFGRLLAMTPEGQRVSIGLAAAAAGEPLDAVVGRADAALYESKRAGGGTLSISPGPAAAGAQLSLAWAGDQPAASVVARTSR